MSWMDRWIQRQCIDRAIRNIPSEIAPDSFPGKERLMEFLRS
jgi:hypothetical protein